MRLVHGFAAVLALAAVFQSATVEAARMQAIAIPKPPPTAATVEMVQAPAWVDRNGRVLPLAVGMELRNGDVVRTGEGARAYVKLAEGSRVKLSEAAQLTLHSRSLKPNVRFRGALDVAAGAFRVTTGMLAKLRKRELTVRVGTATIGIRGTDVWGKTDKDADLVALLEGRVEVTRNGQAPEALKPMNYFYAPRGQVGEVKPLDAALVPKMARQTEIMTGDGAANAKGKWRVLAAISDNEEMALELYDQLRESGFNAKIRPLPGLQEPGWPWWNYEIQLLGFPTEADAKLAATRLKAATGIEAKGIQVRK